MSNIEAPWCGTCGKNVTEILCRSCFLWWQKNAPEGTTQSEFIILDPRSAENERAKIVAWLRGDWSVYDTAQRAKMFADLIEAGQHLK